MTGLPPKDPFRMRSQCMCGSVEGYIRETGAQDVVRCMACDKFQYNAPRVETGKAVRTVSTVHAAISTKKRAEILCRGGFRCEACGRSPTKPSVELHVGHVVSVKRGIEMGLSDAEINSDENLMALCAECNLGIQAETIPVRLLVTVIMARKREQRS
jgi:5-methylcytosine-specific restriction endonuclease McrA